MIGTRIKGLGISLITFFFLLFVFLYPIPYVLDPIHAVDSTPSSDIRSKLDALKTEIASKAAKLKQEVNQKLQNRAYIGNVKVKSANSITLSSASGPKIVNVNQDTVYVSNEKKYKTYSLKNMVEEDFLAALGDIDDTGVLTAKKIILLPTTQNPKLKTVEWGQIISMSNKSVSLKNRDQKNITLLIDVDTKFKKGDDEIIFSNLKLNDFAIVTGTQTQNGSLESSFIYILPQGSAVKPKVKSASPSAKPK